MRPEYIILRTKNVGDIMIDKSYLSIYEAIDRLVTAKRKLFMGMNNDDADQLFNDIEHQTFGDWYSSTPLDPDDPAYDRRPVIEVRD